MISPCSARRSRNGARGLTGLMPWTRRTGRPPPDLNVSRLMLPTCNGLVIRRIALPRQEISNNEAACNNDDAATSSDAEIRNQPVTFRDGQINDFWPVVKCDHMSSIGFSMHRIKRVCPQFIEK